MRVRSITNTFFKGGYTIEAVGAITCSIRADDSVHVCGDGTEVPMKGNLFRLVRYSNLEKESATDRTVE